MAVFPAQLISREKTIDDKGVEHYAYVYRVISNIKNESEEVVASATGLPVFMQSHPVNLNARVKTLSYKQTESNMLEWLVTVNYDTSPYEEGSTAEDPGETSQQTEPDDRPKTITYDTFDIEVPMEYDWSDTPKEVVNTVGKPFDPMPTEKIAIEVVKMVYYSTTYTPAVRRNYQNHVNDDDVIIDGVTYHEGRLLCAKMIGNQRFENAAGKVWKIEVTHHYNPKKRWDKMELLNQGTMAYTGELGDFDPVVITDKDGNNISQPSLLAEDGTVLPEGDPPFYCEFKKHKEADFTIFAD